MIGPSKGMMSQNQMAQPRRPTPGQQGNQMGGMAARIGQAAMGGMQRGMQQRQQPPAGNMGNSFGQPIQRPQMPYMPQTIQPVPQQEPQLLQQTQPEYGIGPRMEMQNQWMQRKRLPMGDNQMEEMIG